MYQNVKSIKKHFEDVKCNKEFQTADVLLFCETWIGEDGPSTDNYELDNFKTPVRVKGRNDHRGLMAYTKHKSRFTNITVT